MKKQTRSILQELSALGTQRSSELLLETRGNHIIESATNLLNLIKEQYSFEEADELERRFINAVRTGDARKFSRGIHKIIESRKNLPPVVDE